MKVSADQVKKLVRYDSETGKIFWKERGEEFFSTSKTHMKRAVSTWNARYAGKEITSKSSHGHIIVHFNLGKRFRTGAHRVAWCIYHGDWPDGLIDHMNGVPDDNRISNLRVATHSQNSRNGRISRRNTSGKVGVTFFKRTQKWRAWISVDGRQISLGYHETKDAAIAARLAAEDMHGYFEAIRKSETQEFI